MNSTKRAIYVIYAIYIVCAVYTLYMLYMFTAAAFAVNSLAESCENGMNVTELTRGLSRPDFYTLLHPCGCSNSETGHQCLSRVAIQIRHANAQWPPKSNSHTHTRGVIWRPNNQLRLRDGITVQLTRGCPVIECAFNYSIQLQSTTINYNQQSVIAKGRDQ